MTTALGNLIHTIKSVLESLFGYRALPQLPAAANGAEVYQPAAHSGYSKSQAASAKKPVEVKPGQVKTSLNTQLKSPSVSLPFQVQEVGVPVVLDIEGIENSHSAAVSAAAPESTPEVLTADAPAFEHLSFQHPEMSEILSDGNGVVDANREAPCVGASLDLEQEIAALIAQSLPSGQSFELPDEFLLEDLEESNPFQLMAELLELEPLTTIAEPAKDSEQIEPSIEEPALAKWAVEEEEAEEKEEAESPQAIFERGQTHWRSQQMDEAIVAYQEAIQADPTFFQAHYSLGRAQFKKGMIVEAIASFQQVTQLNAKFVQAYESLGRAYLRQSQTEQAIQAFQKAAELKPQWEQGYEGLGRAYLQQKQWILAIGAFQKALELKPAFMLAFDGLGRAQFHNRQLDEAAVALEQALALNPNHKPAQNLLARVQDQRQK